MDNEEKESVLVDGIDAALNRYMINLLQTPLEGILSGNTRSKKLDDKGLKEAEELFKNPIINSSIHTVIFSALKKKLTFCPNPKAKNPKNSEEMAKFFNWSIKRFKGSVNNVNYNLMLSYYYGNYKVARTVKVEQGGEYNGFAFYDDFKALRFGLWDFSYDESDNVNGLRSLLNPSVKYPLESFMYMSYLPTDNNPNGNGKFSEVWKYAKAEKEVLPFAMSLLLKHSRTFFPVLRGQPEAVNNGVKTTIKSIMAKIERGQGVHLPDNDEDAATLDIHNFSLSDIDVFIKFFNFLHKMIASAILGTSLTSQENSKVGSYAQSKNATETVTNQILDYMCSELIEVWQEQYLKPLALRNFDINKYPLDDYPIIKLEEGQRKDFKLLADIYSILISNEVLDLTTETDNKFIREVFELPENTELLFDDDSENINPELINKSIQMIIKLKDRLKNTDIDLSDLEKEANELQKQLQAN